MSVLYTDNPKSGNWKATPAIITNLQDPDLFLMMTAVLTCSGALPTSGPFAA